MNKLVFSVIQSKVFIITYSIVYIYILTVDIFVEHDGGWNIKILKIIVETNTKVDIQKCRLRLIYQIICNLSSR